MSQTKIPFLARLKQGDIRNAWELNFISAFFTYTVTAIIALATATDSALSSLPSAVYLVLNAFAPTTFTFVSVVAVQNIILVGNKDDWGRRLMPTVHLLAFSAIYVLLYLLVFLRFDAYESVGWNVALGLSTLALLRYCFFTIEAAEQTGPDNRNPIVTTPGSTRV